MADDTTGPVRRTLPKGQLLIDGHWRDAADGATTRSIDPTTEEPVADIAKGTAEDAGDAVAAARRAFEDGPWPRMHAEERARILFRTADLIDAQRDEFALRKAMDMGMPYLTARDLIMPFAASMFRYFGGLAMQIAGANRASFEPDLDITTRREPLGVVAAITPFNFPMTLSVTKIAPALAAGNTVVHKPATDTPLTALLLAQVLMDAGLPPGVFNLVTGGGSSAGDALVRHADVDKVAFTGSTKVGQDIVRQSADTLKHTTMELGGKSPNIVFADVDLDRAVETAFQAIFWNKGEVCMAGSRILVERPIYGAFVEKLVARTQAAVLGDPLDPVTTVGPVASKAEFDKVMRYVEAGRASDARLVAGGSARPLNGKGYFVEPTLFTDAGNDLVISREEIFGPVAPIIPFDGEDDAIRIANDTPYGLASGIQTRDVGRAMRLAKRIKAGTVWINTWHKYHPAAPFGGYKMSGFGREQGPEVLEAYTQHKTVWIDQA